MPRILLVEDDPEVQLLVEHILLDANYEVDSCETVGGGAELLSCRDYDLLVADGRLRDGNGTLLADRARAIGIPALIMTGYAFVLPGLGGGRSHYDVLLKPISPEELLASVEQALASRD